jgi:hypothetical protein
MPRNNEYSRIQRGSFDTLCMPSGIRRVRSAVVALTLLIAFLNSACLFRGKKSAVMPSAPIRIAFLPFNTPEGNADLRWASMAMPIMMAQITKNSQGLEVVPLWETMQFALESVGSSRFVSDQAGAYVANWVSAKWSVMGGLTQEKKDEVSLLVDFIPSRDTSLPFRYVKSVKMDSIDLNVRKSFTQFLGYISARPLEREEKKRTRLVSLRQLAEALDREYGWTVPAERGKAEEIVTNLAKSDMQLARYLFDPSVYPVLEEN